MSVVPLNVARVSMQMQGSLLAGTLQQGQVDLLKVQQQISTGQRLNRPSDDPGALLSIETLKRQMSANDNYSSNLDFASGFLSQALRTRTERSDSVTIPRPARWIATAARTRWTTSTSSMPASSPRAAR